jgi:tight adherence protein C
MEVIVIQLMAFSAAVLLVIGLDALFRGERRAPQGGKPLLFRVFGLEISALGQLAAAPVNEAFPVQTRQVRMDLVTASLPLTVLEIRGAQAFLCGVLGAVGGSVAFVLSLNWVLGVLALGLLAPTGWVLPVTWTRGCARRRQDAMSRALPYSIDLITTAMQAGQDFGAAVRHYVREGPIGPLRQELAVTLREIELGKSRIEGLKAMADRIQLEEFRILVGAVTQSSEMGASIAETLKIQAEEIRRARYHKAERQAARAPSLMLIPTALFILPAVFIIIFTPVIIRIMASGISGYLQH